MDASTVAERYYGRLNDEMSGPEYDESEDDSAIDARDNDRAHFDEYQAANITINDLWGE